GSAGSHLSTSRCKAEIWHAATRSVTLVCWRRVPGRRPGDGQLVFRRGVRARRKGENRQFYLRAEGPHREGRNEGNLEQEQRQAPHHRLGSRPVQIEGA